MRPTPHLVCVVDDDESVRQSVPYLLSQLGFAVEVFSSATEFLASHDVQRTECLLLDVIMPGMSGPELQRELKLRGLQIPIIFITGQTDETLRRRLLAEGAVDCLFKPFNETALMSALNRVFRVG
jgi:FixJ family two-component response regulator